MPASAGPFELMLLVLLLHRPHAPSAAPAASAALVASGERSAEAEAAPCAARRGASWPPCLLRNASAVTKQISDSGADRRQTIYIRAEAACSSRRRLDNGMFQPSSNLRNIKYVRDEAACFSRVAIDMLQSATGPRRPSNIDKRNIRQERIIAENKQTCFPCKAVVSA